MVGGLGPSGLVTENRSVRHCDEDATDTVPTGETTPDLAARIATDAVDVLGPLVTKVDRSRRSCKQHVKVLLGFFGGGRHSP